MIFAHTLLALVLAASSPSDTLMTADSLLAALTRGGYTVVWRHPATNQSTQDAPGYPNTPRFQQRNLSDRGIADAKAVGAIFKDHHVPISEIVVSPMFRTRETAEYAFGRSGTVDSLLIALKSSPAQRHLLTTAPAPGTNRVLITHHFVIENNAPGIKPGDVGEGEAVVLKAAGDDLRTIGVFKMADWIRLHDQGSQQATEGPTKLATASDTGGSYAQPAAASNSDAPVATPGLLKDAKYSAIVEYLQAFNAGNVARMRDVYARIVLPNPQRSLDQRMESYGGLKEQLGIVSITSADVTGPNEVTVGFRSNRDKLGRITVTLEDKPPHRIAAMMFQTTN